MDTVRAAVATLAGAPRPKKLKRALVGDWKLTFVSDEAALAPFVVRAGQHNMGNLGMPPIR